jgi:flagellar basal-body rod protein FlgB
MNGMERTLSMLQRGMDVATLRQSVIANNMANAEVPEFKRSEVAFESSLRRALEAERHPPLVQMATTTPAHFSNMPESTWQDVQPRRVTDYLSTAKNNGNNVDPEVEVNLLVQNQLLYRLLAQSISFEFNQVATAMRV